jgi:hypothetical protein
MAVKVTVPSAFKVEVTTVRSLTDQDSFDTSAPGVGVTPSASSGTAFAARDWPTSIVAESMVPPITTFKFVVR